MGSRATANTRSYPAKVEDFCDKDLLQLINLARFLFGKPIPACREARLDFGGLARNRTGVQGFAVLCVTTPPRGLRAAL